MTQAKRKDPELESPVGAILPMGSLEAILSEAQEQVGVLPSTWLLPRKAIVDFGGRRWKVRFYPTEAEAESHEAYLRRASQGLPMSALLGRRGACLVFAWPDIDPSPHDNFELLAGIGEFLAGLGEMACPGTSAEALMGELDVWLNHLEQSRLLSARSRRWVSRRLEATCPERPRVSLEYLDAMPHNFGWIAGKLAMLDEKHLRPSFTGVGLVKPRYILPAAAYKSLRQGFERYCSDEGRSNPDEFLELYYFVYALQFYAQRMSEGERRLPAVARLRRYRRWLVARAAPSSLADVLENLRFIAAYPVEAVLFATSKVRFFLSGSPRLQAESPSTSP